MPDKISLTVPARGEYAKTVRMTAAALAGRMEFGYDEVDDVRMAAEEAFVYAVETLTDTDDVEFTFYVDGDALAIEVKLGDESLRSEEEIDRHTSYATFILQSVCDDFELVSDEHGRRSLTLIKRVGDGDGV